MHHSSKFTLAKSLATMGLALLLSVSASAKPSESGLDLDNLDPSTPASQDFFQYANGGWLKANPIPADKPRWGTFNQLFENNQAKLHVILQECAQGKSSDAEARKLGDFFKSGMEPAGQAAGLAHVRSAVSQIGKIDDPVKLQAFVAAQHKQGVRPYFYFDAGQDYKDSTKVIGQVNQGGLGLPDRDYYTKDDAKSVQIRSQYLTLIEEMFKKYGDAPELASAKAKQVLELETSLARNSLTLVEQRNPDATYHPVSLSELASQAPGWDWKAYFNTLGTPALTSINLTSPKFFEGLAKLLSEVPLENHRSYLQWQVLRTSADYLTEDWAELSFGFYGKVLTGAQENTVRWRRVVKEIDGDMGDALGKKYVERHFPPAAKAKVEDMVKRLRGALGTTIDQLEWMSPATKQQAQTKLASFRAKIGYPNRWKDYSTLTIVPDDYLGNVHRADAFAVAQDLAKIGKPRDPEHWYMTPPTVNAYYDPQNNEIVFPAGILQVPFFSLEADDSVNYGGLGMVIGHEITHGFDDQGAQFDAQGNLRNWWTEEDLKKFKVLAQGIEEQFSAYTVADGLHLNGKLVLGESIADLGGLKLALMAYRDSQKGKEAKVMDGFTPDQRFFLSYARIWAMNLRPEYERLQVNTDPHPHPRYRVNGPLSNLEEFQKSFSIPADSAMVRKPRNRVW